jgi:hypothetical protein
MARKRKPRFRVRPRDRNVWTNSIWRVWRGELRRRPGPPSESLFTVVAEKLPYDSLQAVGRVMKQHGLSRTGVYVAHDSMGTARYVGRGRIFARLKTHHRKYPLVLLYYSFYVVPNKSHEREVETLLIRAAGPLLEFNQRKKRITISAGSIRDYEAGTVYFQRHSRRQSSKSKRRRKTTG